MRVAGNLEFQVRLISFTHYMAITKAMIIVKQNFPNSITKDFDLNV